MITPEQFFAIILPSALAIGVVFAYFVFKALNNVTKRMRKEADKT